MGELGPCFGLIFGPIFGDVIKSPALILGLLLNPFLSLVFELVFWACAPFFLYFIHQIKKITGHSHFHQLIHKFNFSCELMKFKAHPNPPNLKHMYHNDVYLFMFGSP